MSDVSPDAAARFLEVLRTLPLWLFGGLAAAAFAVLFMPAFGGIDLAPFRSAWGVWVWVAGIVFLILTIARALDLLVTALRAHRRSRATNRALRLVPLDHQGWWHLAKQRDDSFISQISLHIEAANMTDRPVRIVRTRLVRPWTKGAVIHADVLLPMAGSPYHSNTHAVPPHEVIKASLHIMVRAALASQGRHLRVTLGLTDQFGDEYLLRRVTIPTQDVRPPLVAWAVRLRSLWRFLSLLWASGGGRKAVETTTPAAGSTAGNMMRSISSSMRRSGTMRRADESAKDSAV